MTTQAEVGLITAMISLIIQAETGRSETDIAMPTLIQGVLDEITVTVGPEGGFAYLVHRAGAAGVEFEKIMNVLNVGQAVFCMLPRVLYEAVSNGVEVSARNMNN